MPLPIAGEATVTVLEAHPISIHGDLYVDLAVLTEGDEAPTMVRVPAHLFSFEGESPRLPAPGTRLVVRVLLGQIDGIRPASEETA